MDLKKKKDSTLFRAILHSVIKERFRFWVKEYFMEVFDMFDSLEPRTSQCWMERKKWLSGSDRPAGNAASVRLSHWILTIVCHFVFVIEESEILYKGKD